MTEQTVLKVLSEKKKKRLLVDYCNWCEEQLFPDSPDARNIYTMENILSRVSSREIELVNRVARAQMEQDQPIVHQGNLLATSLLNVLRKAGMLNSDTEPSGAELVMFAEQFCGQDQPKPLNDEQLQEKINEVCRYWFNWKKDGSESLYGGSSFSLDMANMFQALIQSKIDEANSKWVGVLKKYKVTVDSPESLAAAVDILIEEASCPGEIIQRTARLIGATYPKADMNKGDEHFVPCPLLAHEVEKERETFVELVEGAGKPDNPFCKTCWFRLNIDVVKCETCTCMFLAGVSADRKAILDSLKEGKCQY